MERNAHYLIVGIFVASALAIGALLLVWIAESYDARAYKRYTVYFEGAVNGLSEGSKVTYRGVNVGNVLTIRFDPLRPERIKTVIEVEETTPISSSSSVSLRAVGITGLSALAIKTDALGEPLTVLDGEKYPVIASELSGLDKFLSNAPRITDNAIDLLSNVNALLSVENLESINNILNNVEAASAGLSMAMEQENMRHITQTIARIDTMSKKLDAMMSEENRTHITQTVKHLHDSSKALHNILDGNQKQLSRFTGDNLDQIAILVKEAQEMVNAFKILAKKLADDPSRILYQPNYEGVKVEQR